MWHVGSYCSMLGQKLFFRLSISSFCNEHDADGRTFFIAWVGLQSFAGSCNTKGSTKQIVFIFRVKDENIIEFSLVVK